MAIFDIDDDFAYDCINCESEKLIDDDLLSDYSFLLSFIDNLKNDNPNDNQFLHYMDISPFTEMQIKEISDVGHIWENTKVIHNKIPGVTNCIQYDENKKSFILQVLQHMKTNTKNYDFVISRNIESFEEFLYKFDKQISKQISYEKYKTLKIKIYCVDFSNDSWEKLINVIEKLKNYIYFKNQIHIIFFDCVNISQKNVKDIISKDYISCCRFELCDFIDKFQFDFDLPLDKSYDTNVMFEDCKNISFNDEDIKKYLQKDNLYKASGYPFQFKKEYSIITEKNKVNIEIIPSENIVKDICPTPIGLHNGYIPVYDATDDISSVNIKIGKLYTNRYWKYVISIFDDELYKHIFLNSEE